MALVVFGNFLAASSVAAEDAMRVHFIDVGQGAAALVEFPCAAVLIDTGGERWPAEPWKPAKYDSTRALMTYLEAFFAGRPDLHRSLALLVLTHPHLDHTRGVRAVVSAFKPRSVVYNGQDQGSGIDGQHRARDYAKANASVTSWFVLEKSIANSGLTNAAIDPVACTGTDPRIRVLWGQVQNSVGWDAADFSDENNHSVVVRVDYGAASVLFTGDLERAIQDGQRAGIERLITAYKGTKLLDVDVYHVGHHGSYNGTTKALLDAISPKIAVISAGPACPRDGFSAFSFGHPRASTVRALEDAVTTTRPAKNVRVFESFGSKPIFHKETKAIYSTGWDGTTVLEARTDGTWRTLSTSGMQACVP